MFNFQMPIATKGEGIESPVHVGIDQTSTLDLLYRLVHKDPAIGLSGDTPAPFQNAKNRYLPESASYMIALVSTTSSRLVDFYCLARQLLGKDHTSDNHKHSKRSQVADACLRRGLVGGDLELKYPQQPQPGRKIRLRLRQPVATPFSDVKAHSETVVHPAVSAIVTKYTAVFITGMLQPTLRCGTRLHKILKTFEIRSISTKSSAKCLQSLK